MQLKNDLFLRACKNDFVERTPIWIMRQAGRYLPEYRKIREKYDFLTMCKTPELAAEVTIQPVDILGVDAAIIFSDILVLPEAMGMKLELIENLGPKFYEPIRNEMDIKKLKRIDPSKDLKFVLDAILLTKRELNNRVPLIGFSGSPWSLLTYMVEGGTSKNFSEIKKFIFNNPVAAHKLLNLISDCISDYLTAQIENGADAIQIFDTWGGLLSQNHYEEFSLQYISKIIPQVSRKDHPIIVFSKGVHCIDKLANCGASVIGLDWTIDLGEAKKVVNGKVALQGNLDPTILYAPKEKIKEEVLRILKSFGTGSGHIFNLGHGILPDVNPDNAKYLVEVVKEVSPMFH